MGQFRGCVAAGALGLAAAITGMPAAGAQSGFGCTGLAGRHSLPSVEGRDGVFYRIDPDLHMFHGISDESVDRMAAFARALGETGTTLIYVPVPTRALAMPGHLPPVARDYGFDADLAATVHDDDLRRLAGAGVVGVNMRRALRTVPDDVLPFFATDPRLSPDAAAHVAGAIAGAIAATPGFDALPRARFATQTGAPEVLPSLMRARLQRFCLTALPQVETARHTTTLTAAAARPADNSIFGTRVAMPRIAMVGTDVTGSDVSNLAGYLSEKTGLEVLRYAVPDGGSFAAISTYLTSAEFEDTRPAYLVWLNPVENNLARFGDQPFAELTAAASGTCRIAVPLSIGSGANSMRADLNGLTRGAGHTLYLDADGAQAGRAQFDFVAPGGLVTRKSVLRHADQVKTGRFYMPMTGLGEAGAQSVEITLDVPFGRNARVMACTE